MNKNIGSMVSWRTKFAVAAVALASVFTAWGQQYFDQLSLDSAVWADWTAASKEGLAVDYDYAVITFLGEGAPAAIDTSKVDEIYSPDRKTLQNYSWDSSNTIESFYVTVYKGETAVGVTATTLWHELTTITQKLGTIGGTDVYLRTIRLGAPAVPEPTSGLLLLLGVAGLALKRRRQVA